MKAQYINLLILGVRYIGRLLEKRPWLAKCATSDSNITYYLPVV